MIFNILGVIWVSLIFTQFLSAINWFILKIGGTSPYESAHAIPIALSIFHTTFNIANVLVFIWFTKFIQLIVTKMVPQTEDTEEFRLQFISTGLLSTSELSIHQAKQEIMVFATRIEKMYGYVVEMFTETNEKKFYKLYDKIEKYEGICDRMEEEIADYITKISEGELSIIGSKRIKAMLNVVTDMESIGDSCYNIAKTLLRKRDKKILFDTPVNENIIQMMKLAEKSLIEMQKNLEHGYRNINIHSALELEEKINRFRTKLKKDHLKSVEKKEYDYQSGIVYIDLVCECEKLADFSINVSEAIEEINK